MSTELRFTIHDLEILPENGNRYEIIDGELYVSTQPHWQHQFACGEIFFALRGWSEQSGAGLAIAAPGVVFAEDEAGLPAGWLPHGAERHGFAPGTNSISLVFANGAANIRRRGAMKETPEEDALQGMHRMADFLRVPNIPALAGYEDGTPGILTLIQCRELTGIDPFR